jgi:hypothetical protein
MFVSGLIFRESSGFLFAGEEARKKRAFFPEDVIDSKNPFHLCLLSRFGVVNCPMGVLHNIRQQVDGLHVKQKPFIHIRDEEFSPRYHPVCQLVLSLLSLINHFVRYNGPSRHQLLCSFAAVHGCSLSFE